MSSVAFIVSEDDGSQTHYYISSQFVPILNRINGRKFIFSNTITCDDPYVMIDSELTNFLTSFRMGRYTKKWINFGTQIEVIEIESTLPVCPINSYEIFLGH